MIENDPGNPRIERLQVIHLCEADYNLSLKLLWGSRMVHQGEDNNCFGNQQHGSRPRHQCINAVFMKTLTYDLTRILHLSLIMFNNDATGCFDRIMVSLAMIAAFQLGMPRPVARMHSSALLHMKYFVKTTHGISEEVSSVWYKTRKWSICSGVAVHNLSTYCPDSHGSDRNDICQSVG